MAGFMVMATTACVKLCAWRRRLFGGHIQMSWRFQDGLFETASIIMRLDLRSLNTSAESRDETRLKLSITKTPRALPCRS